MVGSVVPAKEERPLPTLLRGTGGVAGTAGPIAMCAWCPEQPNFNQWPSWRPLYRGLDSKRDVSTPPEHLKRSTRREPNHANPSKETQL